MAHDSMMQSTRNRIKLKMRMEKKTIEAHLIQNCKNIFFSLLKSIKSFWPDSVRCGFFFSSPIIPRYTCLLLLKALIWICCAISKEASNEVLFILRFEFIKEHSIRIGEQWQLTKKKKNEKNNNKKTVAKI